MLALKRLEMGLLHKVVLLWDDPREWAKVDLQRRFIFPGDNSDTFSMLVNLQSETYHSGAQWGYAFYSALPFAELAEAMPEAQLVALALDTLAQGLKELAACQTEAEAGAGVSAGDSRLLLPAASAPTPASAGAGAGEGAELPLPSRVFTTRWLHDPYSLGAYSCLPQGASLEHFDAFAQPHGRVLFAGEHTQSKDFGCLHAALESGQRAANDLLQRLC
jgi:hypothetical protein